MGQKPNSVHPVFNVLPNLRGIFLCFIVLVSSFQYAAAQEKLNKLVLERQQLHQQWQQSETKKSGIFGNRTKKDMVATNEWMSRIIQKDNQIMEELEMLKEIETTEISHEKEDYKFIAQKQQGDIGILKRTLESKELELKEAKSKYRTNEWAAFIFFLSTVCLGYLYFTGKRKNKQITV
jgi:hypothetical protein